MHVLQCALPGDVVAIAQKALIFEQCIEYVHYQCHFYTGIAIFYTARTYVLQCKIALLWLFSAASWSSVFFYTGIVKGSSAKKRTDVLGLGNRVGFSFRVVALWCR